MTIIRPARRRRYTIIDNAAIEDDRLTFRAVGLLAYILSKPDDWNVSYRHLSTTHHDGEHSVREGLKELEAAGYIVREREQRPDGTFQAICTVHERPTGETATVRRSSVRGESPHGATRDNARNPRSDRAAVLAARKTAAEVTTEEQVPQEIGDSGLTEHGAGDGSGAVSAAPRPRKEVGRQGVTRARDALRTRVEGTTDGNTGRAVT